MVMHVMMAPSAPAAMVIPFGVCGFIEGEFLADADIQFAHSVSIESGFGPARPILAADGDIIIKSSNVNLTHQIIIIVIQAIDSYDIFKGSFKEYRQPSGGAGAPKKRGPYKRKGTSSV
jgi:hypothetical protein